MFGALLLFGTLALIIVGTWLLRRRSRNVDDYYERDYQDPPAFDAGGFLGGSPFGG